MDTGPGHRQIIISPQIYVPLGPPASADPVAGAQLCRTEIPIAWLQEGDNFRLDIELPQFSTLELVFAASVASLHVNGETVWANDAIQPIRLGGVQVKRTAAELRLTCTNGGTLHVLALGVVSALPVAAPAPD